MMKDLKKAFIALILTAAAPLGAVMPAAMDEGERRLRAHTATPAGDGATHGLTAPQMLRTFDEAQKNLFDQVVHTFRNFSRLSKIQPRYEDKKTKAELKVEIQQILGRLRQQLRELRGTRQRIQDVLKDVKESNPYYKAAVRDLALAKSAITTFTQLVQEGKDPERALMIMQNIANRHRELKVIGDFLDKDLVHNAERTGRIDVVVGEIDRVLGMLDESVSGHGRLSRTASRIKAAAHADHA